MAMDVIGFGALYNSAYRLMCHDRIETAVITQAAAQGTGKELEDALKPWREAISSTGGKKTAKDFKNRFGKGF